MSIYLKNKNEIKKYLLRQSVLIEKALIYYLEFFVEELINHAKLSGEFNDITSNLRSSIGGTVLKDGKPVTYRGFEGTQDGESEGKTFLETIISNFTKGYAIIIVAGMEYATYVENYHGLNVLKKTELKLQSEMPSILKKLKAAIDRI